MSSILIKEQSNVILVDGAKSELPDLSAYALKSDLSLFASINHSHPGYLTTLPAHSHPEYTNPDVSKFITREEVPNVTEVSAELAGLKANVNQISKQTAFAQGLQEVLDYDITDGRYYNYTNGIVASSVNSALVSLIKVTPGDQIRILNGANYVYYKADNSYLSGKELQSSETDITLTIPFNVAYLGVTIRVDEKSIFRLEPIKRAEPLYRVDSNTIRIDQHTHEQEFLRVPTPYTDGSQRPWAGHQATHPSVVQFETPWNGFKYWMAFTPYPNANDQRENPCLVASNDGLKWVIPSGITNPLTGVPGIGGYNSDTHLMYRKDLNQLEVWYRSVKPSKTGEVIKRIIVSSTLAVGAPETIIETTVGSGVSNVLQYISPSVMYENGKYKLWIMKDWIVQYQESANLKNWSAPQRVKADGKDVYSWHPCVVKRRSRYIMLNCHATNTLGQGGVIKVSDSPDGINFTSEKTILSTSLHPFNLDGRALYRATPIWIGDSVGVIHGMVSQSNAWTIGMGVGPSFDRLQCISKTHLEHYGAL